MSETAPWFSLPKPPRPALSSFSVLIIGAGLGGSWLARTLAERGIASTVVESNDIASGASGSTVGVVKPYVTRAPCFTEYFYNKAYGYLLQRLSDWQLRERCGFNPCGVLQLCHEPFPERLSEPLSAQLSDQQYERLSTQGSERQYERLSTQGSEPSSERDSKLGSRHGSQLGSEWGTYSSLTPAEASARAGVDISHHGLWFGDGGYLDPRSLCHALLEHPLIKLVTNNEVIHIDTSDESAHVTMMDKQELQADVIILATGSSLRKFPATQHLAVVPARGQTSDFRCLSSSEMPRCVISSKRYVIPRKDSVTTGATFMRDDNKLGLSDEEHQQNYQGLLDMLPGLECNSTPVNGYAGVRATTPDRLPLVGPVPDHAVTADAYHDLHHGRPQQDYPKLPTIPRLMVLGGFGSRGIVTTAYSAHLLADYLLDMAPATDSLTSFSSLLNPVRFQIRALKRRQ